MREECEEKLGLVQFFFSDMMYNDDRWMVQERTKER